MKYQYFHSIINDNGVTNSEIMDWATGDNEHSHVHDIDGANDNSTEDLNDNCNVQESIDINKVITSFNLAIERSNHLIYIDDYFFQFSNRMV